MSFFNKSAAPFPMMLPRAQIEKDDNPPAVVSMFGQFCHLRLAEKVQI